MACLRTVSFNPIRPGLFEVPRIGSDRARGGGGVVPRPTTLKVLMILK